VSASLHFCDEDGLATRTTTQYLRPAREANKRARSCCRAATCSTQYVVTCRPGRRSFTRWKRGSTYRSATHVPRGALRAHLTRPRILRKDSSTGLYYFLPCNQGPKLCPPCRTIYFGQLDELELAEEKSVLALSSLSGAHPQLCAFKSFTDVPADTPAALPPQLATKRLCRRAMGRRTRAENYARLELS